MSAPSKSAISYGEASFPIQSQRLIDWCKYDALPLWGDLGTDKSGGFYERLNYDGTPDRSAKRRVRVQARQCYVYSLATINGWYGGASQAADHGWAFLTQQGLAGGEKFGSAGFKGCAHLLNPDGSLHDGARDTYAQAFLILASAWRYRATSDAQALDMLYAATTFMTRYFKAKNSGYYEDCSQSLPRRQNPHMHLFEAFMSAYQATQDGLFLELADDIFSLFKTRFYDLKNKCVLEYFDTDWTPLDREQARIEPGHMMEWSWLLEWYGRLSGRDVKQYANELFLSALRNGLNHKTGLLINEYRLDGTASNNSSRLWPQTEYLKACIARHRLGHREALLEATSVIDRIFADYLQTPLCGGWHDSLSSKACVESQHMPSSSFYHLACAVSEAEDIRNKESLNPQKRSA